MAMTTPRATIRWGRPSATNRSSRRRRKTLARRLRATVIIRPDLPAIFRRDRHAIIPRLARLAATALRALRRAGASRLVLAVPGGSWKSAATLQSEADEVVILETPRPFVAVGHAYEDFDIVEDDAVISLLDEAWSRT